ncbi:hypothetical protein, partial [Pseudomonas aeruginosa]
RSPATQPSLRSSSASSASSSSSRPLDENGQWFRYHHLFSDLLLARPLPDFGPSAGSLHLRACGWFSRHGLLDQAV